MSVAELSLGWVCPVVNDWPSIRCESKGIIQWLKMMATRKVRTVSSVPVVCSYLTTPALHTVL